MKSIIMFFVALAAGCSLGYGQGTIPGQVVDSETGEPLAGASVFAQNTTKGTITDKEGKFSFYLSKGGYEIVISYTGYLSRKINLELSEDRQFNLKLEKADNSLSEVIIKNTNEVPDGWEKYGQFFLSHFVGATPSAANTKLLNPEALKFLYFKKNERLKVLATEPLQIQNFSLGYNIRYELDSFVHYFGNDQNSYKGFSFYTEMEGDEEQKKTWTENRKNVYYGSRLHFLRAYYDSTLSAEGFNVDIFSPDRFNKFKRLPNPYDTSYYFFDDSTGIAELWFPVKVSISYTKKTPEKEYLKQYKLPADVPIQISYVDLSDPVLVKSNGYFTDQKSWINAGYWSWKNVADQLPYDYEPE